MLPYSGLGVCHGRVALALRWLVPLAMALNSQLRRVESQLDWGMTTKPSEPSHCVAGEMGQCKYDP